MQQHFLKEKNDLSKFFLELSLKGFVILTYKYIF